VRPLRLAYLTYFTVALPGSTLGLLWPSIRLGFHEPIAALGILLVFGVAASVVASAATGRILTWVRMGPLVALSTGLIALALTLEVLAPSLWVFAWGMVLFGIGFGTLDSALNVHAASNFGARDINWMHASYGLGATIGPLVVTAILSGGLTWRWAYGIMAATQAVLTCFFLLARHSWERSVSPQPAPRGVADEPPPERAPGSGQGKRPAGLVVGTLTFSAVETGIESGVGIWGYVFLTAGRGLPHDVAGVAVAAYWAMMFVGRAMLGPVAERVGPTRVLGAAVGGVAFGAGLMTVPGPAALGVIGMMILGLAAAPIFPLMTLTTAERLRITSVARTTQMVSLQVATSAIGAAALPAAMGLAIGALNARILAPLLLALSLAMWGAYVLLSRLTGGSGSGLAAEGPTV